MFTSSFFPDPKQPYSINFDQLPPNHNPLINNDSSITFTNVHAAMKLVSHITLYCEKGELHLDAAETLGFLGMLETAIQALEYELDYRPDCAVERIAEHRFSSMLSKNEKRAVHEVLERLLSVLGFIGYGSDQTQDRPETDLDITDE